MWPFKKKSDEQQVLDQAERLVKFARKKQIVIDISQLPLPDLAMGAHAPYVELRGLRVDGKTHQLIGEKSRVIDDNFDEWMCT